MTIILFITRAQPFHLGHLHAIKLILRECNRILIVIGSSQESHTEKNPFTFEERREMIENSLKAEGISSDRYKIIGIHDVPDDKIWVKSILDKGKFDLVFTLNPWTKKCFEPFGITVRDHPKFGEISGSDIRDRMLKDDNSWKKLVPKETIKVIEKIDIKNRV